MSKKYVDNAENRKLGRVGMEHGTAVHCRSSGASCSDNNAYTESSRGVSVYNSSNRNSGRADHSRSDASNTRPKTYADNAQNRSLGRVGLEHGTAVHHRGETISRSDASNTSLKTYADNAQNRSLGRVGQEHGTAVHHRSETSARCNESDTRPKTYVDNSQNRSLGRVGLEHGTVEHHRGETSARISVLSSSSKTYVDNPQNRNLGRVGLEHGTAVHHRSESGLGYQAVVPKHMRTTHRTEVLEELVWNMVQPYIIEEKQALAIVLRRMLTINLIEVLEELAWNTEQLYIIEMEQLYSIKIKVLGAFQMWNASSEWVHERFTIVYQMWTPAVNGKLKMGSTTYDDNHYNRSLNRVGIEKRTSKHIANKSPRTDSSLASYLDTMTLAEPRVYKDNALNRKLGRVGQLLGTRRHNPRPIAHTTYVDNDYNRRYNRVGKQLGSVLIPRADRVYVDNALNRQLGRVGLLWGTFEGKPKAELLKRLKNLRSDEDIPDDVIRIYERDSTAQELIEKFLEMKERDAYIKKWLEEGSNAFWEPHQHTSKKVMETYRGSVINCRELTFNQRIGHGSFGEVHIAEWREGQLVAVKLLKDKGVSKSRLRDFEREILIICELDHPNIVQFLGACNELPHLAIVMEYMDISLHEALHIKQVDFKEDERVCIMEGIAEGLEYLHMKQIAHCDLKPSNVLLNNVDGEETADSKFPAIAKLSDFGLSLLKFDTETMATSEVCVKNHGTPRYSAPEVLRGELLGVGQMMKADVYSFGSTVVELLLEEVPFEDFHPIQLKEHVGKRGMKPVMKNWHILKSGIRTWLYRCWDEKAQVRPAAQELASFSRSCRKVYNKVC